MMAAIIFSATWPIPACMLQGSTTGFRSQPRLHSDTTTQCLVTEATTTTAVATILLQITHGMVQQAAHLAPLHSNSQYASPRVPPAAAESQDFVYETVLQAERSLGFDPKQHLNTIAAVRPSLCCRLLYFVAVLLKHLHCTPVVLCWPIVAPILYNAHKACDGPDCGSKSWFQIVRQYIEGMH